MNFAEKQANARKVMEARRLAKVNHNGNGKAASIVEDAVATMANVYEPTIAEQGAYALVRGIAEGALIGYYLERGKKDSYGKYYGRLVYVTPKWTTILTIGGKPKQIDIPTEDVFTVDGKEK